MSSPTYKPINIPWGSFGTSTTDALTARLIAEAGFEIAYMGGNATTASTLAYQMLASLP